MPMRLPNRKPGKYTFPQFDPHLTQEKFDELKAELDKLVKKVRPQAARETRQYAENGDFSENAEYQIAKGRLRGINRKIDELQSQVNHAVIIPSPTNTRTVQIGHTVTVSMDGVEKTYRILGPTEANPQGGIISYKSPLGAALLGHQAGGIVSLNLGGKSVQCIIHSISSGR